MPTRWPMPWMKYLPRPAPCRVFAVGVHVVEGDGVEGVGKAVVGVVDMGAAGDEGIHGGGLRAQYDLVDFALAGGEVAVDGHGAGDVRGVHGVFASGIDQKNVAGLHGAAVFGVVKDGGVGAGADDGRVAGAFAAVGHEVREEDAGGGALGHAGMDGGDHRLLGFDGGVRGFVHQGELAGIFRGAENAGEFVDIQEVGRGRQTERGRGPFGQGAGAGVGGLAPEAVLEVAITLEQGAEDGGELGHGQDFGDAGGLDGVGRCGVELGAGVALDAGVAGGEKENFAVAADGVQVLADSGSFDEERGAGLVPAGEVIEVGVLAVGGEVGDGLVGGEEDGDALVEGSAEADAAVVVVGGGLTVEREQGGGEQEQQDQARESHWEKV